jgi:hypothetical protein
MKNIAILIVSILLVAVLLVKTNTGNIVNSVHENYVNEFDLDADKARIEHLVYWTALIEEYYKKTGYYPMQKLSLTPQEKAVLIRIMTKEQRVHLIKGGKKYNPDLDTNYNGIFKEVAVKDFVSELESKLNHNVREYYDIEKVPNKHVLGYHYFVTDKGYLLWGICMTCGVTPITTLLMDGTTPTINIVSAGMKSEVPKSLTRVEILNNKIFKDLQNRPFSKEDFVRRRENETILDSKQ